MRTNLKPKTYFESFIPKQPARIEKFIQRIEEGTVADSNLPSVYRKMFYIEFNTLVAGYSAGKSISELKSDFTKVIDRMEIGWKDDHEVPADKYQFDDYATMLFMLSLSVLLDIEAEQFNRILAILDKSERKDILFEYLIASRVKGREAVTDLMYPKPYKSLLDLITQTDKQDIPNKLNAYLEKKWYTGMKNIYWYENHMSRFDVFFGYWSFEIAAIAKVLEIDDTVLKSNPYYPYDLVHHS